MDPTTPIVNKTLRAQCAAEKIEELCSKIKSKPKCILGCGKHQSLRYVPKDQATRDIWKKKLKLKVIRRGEAICDKHFRNGELQEFIQKAPTCKKKRTYSFRQCVLGCNNPGKLHRVPRSDDRLEMWRNSLKIKGVLKKSSHVCTYHYQIATGKRQISQQKTPTNTEDKINENEKKYEVVESSTCSEIVDDSYSGIHSPLYEVETLESDESESTKPEYINDSEDEIYDDMTQNVMLSVMKSNKYEDDDDFGLSWGFIEEEVGKSHDENKKCPEENDSNVENKIEDESIELSSEKESGYLCSLSVEVLTDEFLQSNEIEGENSPTKRTQNVEKVNESEYEQNDSPIKQKNL